MPGILITISLKHLSLGFFLYYYLYLLLNFVEQ